ncbi:acyltransferase [Myxococcota bacterium]|nr:acyltransferase [Myxococcota bacterium]MBU1382837.1 acyltransferase [Myxococcota bacterium]MBU1498986.1 acyltransferase [Myxococcota bacterium]
MVRAGYVQFTPELGELEANAAKLKELVLSSEHVADLLVFPEMALTGYAFPEKSKLSKVCSPEYNDFTYEFAMEIAQIIGGIVVIGYPEYENGLFYNSAIMTDADKILGNYRKSHLFGAEKDVFERGNSGLNVFDCGKFRVGMMICFDWVFPESARTLALAGADIIAHPVNLVMPYCQRAMFTRSLENGVFTISANRCGSELWGKPLVFTGESVFYDPRGTLLARGPEESDEVRILEIDISYARNKNLNLRNGLFEDRRIDLYDL